eukprot:8516039-Alexandrium_andersonii.AAC.1
MCPGRGVGGSFARELLKPCTHCRLKPLETAGHRKPSLLPGRGLDFRRHVLTLKLRGHGLHKVAGPSHLPRQLLDPGPLCCTRARDDARCVFAPHQ